MKENLKEKASGIKLLITDCDGVLTDGGVYYSDDGENLNTVSPRNDIRSVS